MLVFPHNTEEIILQFVSCDVGKRFIPENGLQIHAEGAFVFLKGRRLCRLLFDFQPVTRIVSEKCRLCRHNGYRRFLGRLNGRTFVKGCQPLQKARTHRLEISSRRLDVHSLAAHPRLEIAVGSDPVIYDVIVCNKNSDMFRHGFDLLFGKLKAVFAFFRKFPYFLVQGNDVHCLANGTHLPVKRRERIFRRGRCRVVYSLFSQCSMLLRELLCSLAHRIQCSLSLRRFPPCNLLFRKLYFQVMKI